MHGLIEALFAVIAGNTICDRKAADAKKIFEILL